MRAVLGSFGVGFILIRGCMHEFDLFVVVIRD